MPGHGRLRRGADRSSRRRLVFGDRLEQALDDLLDFDPLALSGEVADESMAKYWAGDGGDVVGGHMVPALEDGVGLGGQDQVHACPWTCPPGEIAVDEV